MQSAYSSLLKNIIDLINAHKQENNITEKSVKSMDMHIQDINILDNLWLYGIKIGVNEIEKTKSFTKHFTLEPPFTTYNKGAFATLDYIFYKGDLNPIRIYNIPDARKMAMDVGEMPNEYFPSDHLSLCVDFHLI